MRLRGLDVPLPDRWIHGFDVCHYITGEDRSRAGYWARGTDLPFLARRAQILGVPLALGRIGPPGLRVRAARRGYAERSEDRRVRYVAPGRELIDTMDAVLRYDFSARELPSHGLKAVARHLGIAGPDREQILGS